jgi:hypothetical protein
VLKPDGLTAEETAQVAELVRTRYGTDAWLRGGGVTPGDGGA